jgi:hypothetical protein
VLGVGSPDRDVYVAPNRTCPDICGPAVRCLLARVGRGYGLESRGWGELGEHQKVRPTHFSYCVNERDQIANDARSYIQKIRRFAEEWSSLNRIEAYLRENEIKGDITEQHTQLYGFAKDFQVWLC